MNQMPNIIDAIKTQIAAAATAVARIGIPLLSIYSPVVIFVAAAAVYVPGAAAGQVII
jgi:hypothetical protein